MNIELLLEKIRNVLRLLVESGFKRDLEAWKVALVQADVQNNLVRLKEIAESALKSFSALEEASLSDEIDLILPKEETISDLNTIKKLQELIEDPRIDTVTFHSRLTNIFNESDDTVSRNISRIRELEGIFQTYVPEALASPKNKALLAIIFNDAEVTESLPQFAKKLGRWDRALRMYHSLVTNESPEDIGLAAVHGGSIDVVVNINLDVALDITEVLKYGFVALGAYLSYRVAKSEIVKSYGKNKELLALNRKQDELMLANIKTSMEDVLKQKYLKPSSKSRKVSAESPEVKIGQISELFSEHITKGNDVKLLTSGDTEDDETENEEMTSAEQLCEESLKARTLRKQVSAKDLKLLSTKYAIQDSDD